MGFFKSVGRDQRDILILDIRGVNRKKHGAGVSSPFHFLLLSVWKLSYSEIRGNNQMFLLVSMFGAYRVKRPPDGELQYFLK